VRQPDAGRQARHAGANDGYVVVGRGVHRSDLREETAETVTNQNSGRGSFRRENKKGGISDPAQTFVPARPQALAANFGVRYSAQLSSEARCG
jgi:hypothetical protein